MSKIRTICLSLALGCILASCYTTTHTIGTGAKGTQTAEKRVWYALWGLVPINEVDSKQLAGDASNYTIETQHTFLDLVISAITGIVTIQCQTVTVTK